MGFGGTRVHWVVDPAAEWTLLFGDETAVSSIAAIAEARSGGHPVLVVAQVRDEGEHAVLDVPGLSVTWVHRGDRPSADQRSLEEAIHALDFPAGRGQAWGGAEAGAIRRLRRHFLDELGLDRRVVSIQGYWHAASPS